MEIEATWGHIVRIWWALFWRAALLGAAGFILGAVQGFVVGFVLSLFGAPLTATKIVAGLGGLLIGIPLAMLPVKMIVGKDFGDFRLVLVAREPQ